MDKSVYDSVNQTLPAGQDLNARVMANGRFEIGLFYYSSLADEQQMNERLIKPFLVSQDTKQYIDVLLAYGAKEESTITQLPSDAIQGKAIIIAEERIYSLKIMKEINPEPLEVAIENTVHGPQKAFSENLPMNVHLIRALYPRKELAVESRIIGSKSQTQMLLMYDREIANQDALAELNRRLDHVANQVDVLLSAAHLQLLLNGKRYSLFPSAMVTERPDRAQLNLAKGKIVVFIDGSSFCLILPAVFVDFMSSMDDLYHSFWTTRPLLVLRYLSLFITMALPALYVSIVSYNPEIMRVQLALSIAGSRSPVPYPSFFEVLLMLFLIEALMEASIRLPRVIGSTATTVGGLILGQAVQQAGLVSSIMIIVTSAVAICNFVVPINVMSVAIRFTKYGFLVLSVFFGIFGMTIGMLMLVAYLCRLRSYGEPYLRLTFGEKKTATLGRKRSFT